MTPAPAARGALPIVEVLWRDSSQVSHGWQGRAEYRANLRSADLRCRTAGYLLAESDVGVIVVQSIAADADTVSEAIVIPRGCVIRIRRL